MFDASRLHGSVRFVDTRFDLNNLKALANWMHASIEREDVDGSTYSIVNDPFDRHQNP